MRPHFHHRHRHIAGLRKRHRVSQARPLLPKSVPLHFRHRHRNIAWLRKCYLFSHARLHLHNLYIAGLCSFCLSNAAARCCLCEAVRCCLCDAVRFSLCDAARVYVAAQ